MGCALCLYVGEELGRYAFGRDHPFGPLRLSAFVRAAAERGLLARACLCAPVQAEQADIERFHTSAYVRRVRAMSVAGKGLLDAGDTPAFPGVYEAAATVAGSVLDAARRILRGDCRRAFVPIAGLHHAKRDAAAGFCVFNDCGIAIAALLAQGIEPVAYVDIDAHHGDGVYDGFKADPRVIIADIHEDGRFLYPGSGSASETGTGPGRGRKLNIPLPPGAADADFFHAWERAEAFVRAHAPRFILFQCGADSLAGDPITDLAYSEAAHRHAAARLCALADATCASRLLALGGGGYRLDNLAAAWCAVLEAMLNAPAAQDSGEVSG